MRPTRVRQALWLFTALAVGVCAGGVISWAARVRHGSSKAGTMAIEDTLHTDTGPTLQQIQRLSNLVTMKVDVADVQVTEVGGYTGGQKAILLVKGDILLGVDLSQARLESVDSGSRTAVLVLPGPGVHSPRLDQERTRLFTVTSQGLWRLVPGDAGQTAVVNDAYKHAQKVVAEAASEAGLVDQCRRNTQSAVESFFNAASWRVDVKWSDNEGGHVPLDADSVKR